MMDDESDGNAGGKGDCDKNGEKIDDFDNTDGGVGSDAGAGSDAGTSESQVAQACECE